MEIKRKRHPALIFDFGNVVAHFDYTRTCERVAGRLGLTGAQILARARAAGLAPIVKEYECGRMSDHEFAGRFNALTGLTLPYDEFAEAWADIFWLNESVAALVEMLDARGYTLVLGSNTNPIHSGHFRRMFATTIKHFDGCVLSHEVGHVKPASEFFAACARAAHARPEECLFIDDLEENVAGARNAGLRAIVYRDTPGLCEELEQYGILLD